MKKTEIKKNKHYPMWIFLPDNNWDWLALGQQYSLPARLLDWTANPLVACYFAVEERIEDDSVIYAYQNKSYIEVKKHPDPFKYHQVGKFIPRHLTRRITTQGGLFTVHPDPYEPFESNDMEAHYSECDPWSSEEDAQQVWSRPVFPVSRARQLGCAYRVVAIQRLLN